MDDTRNKSKITSNGKKHRILKLKNITILKPGKRVTCQKVYIDTDS